MEQNSESFRVRDRQHPVQYTDQDALRTFLIGPFIVYDDTPVGPSDSDLSACIVQRPTLWS